MGGPILSDLRNQRREINPEMIWCCHGPRQNDCHCFWRTRCWRVWTSGRQLSWLKLGLPWMTLWQRSNHIEIMLYPWFLAPSNKQSPQTQKTIKKYSLHSRSMQSYWMTRECIRVFWRILRIWIEKYMAQQHFNVILERTNWPCCSSSLHPNGRKKTNWLPSYLATLWGPRNEIESL